MAWAPGRYHTLLFVVRCVADRFVAEAFPRERRRVIRSPSVRIRIRVRERDGVHAGTWSMDARVWHYGAAHLGDTPRVLLNVTFQDDPKKRHGDARTPTRVRGFTYHAHESVVDRYVARDFS